MHGEMDKTEYLRYRFKKHNHPKYHKYCDEWIANTTEGQCAYFNIEMKRLKL